MDQMTKRLVLLWAEPDSVGGFDGGNEVAVAPGGGFGCSGEPPGIYDALPTRLDAVVEVVSKRNEPVGTLLAGVVCVLPVFYPGHEAVTIRSLHVPGKVGLCLIKYPLRILRWETDKYIIRTCDTIVLRIRLCRGIDRYVDRHPRGIILSDYRTIKRSLP